MIAAVFLSSVVAVKILLAPMEGLVDPLMRDLLTRIGGIDRCVTEFVRISDRELPNRVYYRMAPELRQGGRTRAGVPVHVQLLGSEPELLAACAEKVCGLGALGVDLNFGCPAKTVNRSRGGAILLNDPALVGAIVAAVRRAVPSSVHFSAKMRLGFDDASMMLDNARAMAEGGVDELCVHARTKREGYRPPAHWDAIARIREAVGVPVVANGEVWTPEDYHRCKTVSGCDDVMIGRALIASPDLANRILEPQRQMLCWDELLPWLLEFFERVSDELSYNPKYAPGRLKQWLALLRRNYPQAALLFETIKRENRVDPILQVLQCSVAQSAQRVSA